MGSIQSVVVEVIKKISDKLEALVKVVNHKYDYRQNWTT